MSEANVLNENKKKFTRIKPTGGSIKLLNRADNLVEVVDISPQKESLKGQTARSIENSTTSNQSNVSIANHSQKITKKFAMRRILTTVKTGSIEKNNTLVVGEIEEENFDDEENRPKNRNYEKMETGMSDVFGFGDDEKSRGKLVAMGDMYYSQAHEITFSLDQYFEFFMYHLIWYGFLGYLFTIAILPFKRMRILFKNLKFYGLQLNIMVFQLLMWLNMVMLWYPLLFLQFPLSNWLSLTMAYVTTLLRSAHVAAKYATFTPALILKYKEAIISEKDLMSETMFGAWRNQDPATIELETVNAMKRNNFDEGIFFVSFLDKLNAEVLNEKVSLEETLKPEFPTSTEIKYCYGGMRDYYSGQIIFYLMVQRFNKEAAKKWRMPRVLVLALFLGLSPLISRSILFLPLYSASIVDSISFYFNMLNSVNVAYFTVLFFDLSMNDINRSIFVMNQLSHMISAQRKPGDVYKMLPTVNFLEQSTLNS